jgi:23S rRNA pseudouridine2605 synthase
VLAAAGLGSRRDCEELITAGRVEVDGEIVTELGTRVDPDTQAIFLDGERVKPKGKVYYAVYKPTGVLCTNADPQGRARVLDLLPETRERLFTVGRLDRSSEGLILVTNDGDLAQRLTHPKYGVEKTYRVLVAGDPTREALTQLTSGVHLAEGLARVKSVRPKGKQGQSTWLEIVLGEGKNREIRRILAKVGHKVMSLKRISVGPLRLGEMEPAEFRRLTPDEVANLQAVAAGVPTSQARVAARKHRKRQRPADAPAPTPRKSSPQGGGAPKKRAKASYPRGKKSSPRRPRS